MKFILYALALLIFTSCSTARIATVTSEKVPLQDGVLVFENDTVKITYLFWSNWGAMRFRVFNKLNIPIYIDLKQSAYIPNSKSFSYWRDEINTESEFSSRSGYFYGTPASHGKSVSKSVKSERIEIVPPQSMAEIKPCRLVASIDAIPMVTASYSISNTPLQFRNFLAISTTEKFEGKISYIDNSFYVSQTKVIPFSKGLKHKKYNCFYTAKNNITYFKDGRYVE